MTAARVVPAPTPTQGHLTMLRWALAFFLIALVAGALGLFGLSGVAMQIAYFLAGLFLILFIISLVVGRRAIDGPPV
jgi:uncharacterized membrane protein YtjA (UPF0391 family)